MATQQQELRQTSSGANFSLPPPALLPRTSQRREKTKIKITPMALIGIWVMMRMEEEMKAMVMATELTQEEEKTNPLSVVSPVFPLPLCQ
jgi:hypothetical protein